MTDQTQPNSKLIANLLLAVAGITGLITIWLIIAGKLTGAGIPMVTAMIAGAFYGKANPKFKGSSFTFWVFAFLAAAMYFPFLFTNWGFNTKVIVIPMLQLIMFGMGTKLSIADFVKEFSKPKGIIIGTVMVFTIMPVLGVIVAKLFQFSPEIAVGVILIGSMPRRCGVKCHGIPRKGQCRPSR